MSEKELEEKIEEEVNENSKDNIDKENSKKKKIQKALDKEEQLKDIDFTKTDLISRMGFDLSLPESNVRIASVNQTPTQTQRLEQSVQGQWTFDKKDDKELYRENPYKEREASSEREYNASQNNTEGKIEYVRPMQETARNINELGRGRIDNVQEQRFSNPELSRQKDDYQINVQQQEVSNVSELGRERVDRPKEYDIRKFS